MLIAKLTYLVSSEEKDRVLSAHRAYLRTQYEAKKFLLSGPLNPPTGGMIISRLANREEFIAIMEADPFITEGIASYEILDLTPVLYDECLKDIIDNT
jgi:uncharacterized protein YciI